MKPRLTALVSACLLAMRGMSLAAPAEPEDASRAEQLFRRGHELLKQGRMDESCASFAASQREDPASGTLLALAYCEERAGRLATAWQEYGRASELAVVEHHAERQSAAKERAEALLPRLSTLTIAVPQPPPDKSQLVVRQDGQEVDRTLWGRPIPVDGGKHVLEASATGRKSWSFVVTIRNEGDHQTVTISELEADAMSPTRVAITTPASEPRAATSPPPVQNDDGRSTRTLHRVGWGLAIAGAASFGIGTVLAIMASSKNDQSNANGHCDASGCDERGTELRNDALSDARLATVSVVLGGVFAASSITIFLLADTSSPRAVGAESPRFVPSRISGVGFGGRF